MNEGKYELSEVETFSWNDSAEYRQFWRILTGQTRAVTIPVDILRKALSESPTLQEKLPPALRRSFDYLNRSNGRFAIQRGTGNTMDILQRVREEDRD